MDARADNLLNEEGRKHITEKLWTPEWRKVIQESKDTLKIDAGLLKELKAE